MIFASIKYLTEHHEALLVSFIMSIIASYITFRTIPKLKQTFINARLSGIDVLKRNRPILPESMGLPVAIIYLIALFLFIPIPFIDWFQDTIAVVHEESPTVGTFPYHKLGEILSAILAIQSMILLGFADDVLMYVGDIKYGFQQ
ncbi:unnamed protein product [Cunninghamella blakesleeana]